MSSSIAFGAIGTETPDDSGNPKPRRTKSKDNSRKAVIPEIPDDDPQFKAIMRGSKSDKKKRTTRPKSEIKLLEERFKKNKRQLINIAKLSDGPLQIPPDMANKAWRFMGSHLRFLAKRATVDTLTDAYSNDTEDMPKGHNVAEIITDFTHRTLGLNPFSMIRDPRWPMLTKAELKKLPSDKRHEAPSIQAQYLAMLAFLPCKGTLTYNATTKSGWLNYVTAWQEGVRTKHEQIREGHLKLVAPRDKMRYKLESELYRLYLGARNVAQQKEAQKYMRQLVDVVRLGLRSQSFTIARAYPVIEDTIANLRKRNAFKELNDLESVRDQEKVFPDFVGRIWQANDAKRNEAYLILHDAKSTKKDKKHARRMENAGATRILTAGAINTIFQSEFDLVYMKDDIKQIERDLDS